MRKTNKSFFSCDSVTHKGVTNTWFTPQNIVKKLGPFDLDPCTESFRPFDTAYHHICYDKGEDGLAHNWNGRVWLNPPYGKDIGLWLDKLAKHGNGIALVFARTETQWAQKHLSCCNAVNFIGGRLIFIRFDGTANTNAGTGSMLLAYGNENAEKLTAISGRCYREQIS